MKHNNGFDAITLMARKTADGEFPVMFSDNIHSNCSHFRTSSPIIATHYLNFTVASAIAASMAPISQNLTTTCVSGHPFCWK